MKKFLTIFVSALALVSCGEQDINFYDSEGGQSLSFFQNSTSALQVPQGAGSAQIDIVIGVSTLSDTARQISVTQVDSATTAAASAYSFDSMVTIPANSYTGILTITGNEEGLTNDQEVIQLRVDRLDESGVVSSALGTHTLSVSLSCPVPDDRFVGSYLIEQTTPYVDGPTIEDGSVVEIAIGESDAQRVFFSKPVPNYCVTREVGVPFVMNFTCGRIMLSRVTSNCSCGSGTIYGETINDVPFATYDVEDDSEFFLTFGDDITNQCGYFTNTTYKFTKQ